MSSEKRNDVRVVRVDAAMMASLRRQTLVVLEFEHFWFESISDRTAAEQEAAARIYRDAFVVLDIIGWRAPAVERPLAVPLSAGHVTQLRRCRADLEQTIADRRAFPTADDAEVAELEAANERDRATSLDLAAIDARVRRRPMSKAWRW